MPRLLVVLLLVAGCTLRNPAFDGQTAAQTTDDATAAPTDTGAPGTAPATDDGPPTGSQSATATAADPTTTTGVDPTDPSTAATTTTDTTNTVDPTATTAGLCTGCGECGECIDGACVPLGTDVACAAPDGPPCEMRVHGLEMGKCYLYAPGAARCDGAGACGWVCEQRGQVVVECDEVCVNHNHNCSPPSQIADVSPASVCVLDAESDGCQTSCGMMGDKPMYYPYACDDAGACELKQGQMIEDCFPGSCQLPEGCTLECQTSDMCSKFAVCDDNECVEA